MQKDKYTFYIQQDPVAYEEAMIVRGVMRFTLLTDTLIRIEKDECQAFENRATQTVIKRKLSLAAFEVIEDENILEIKTQALHLRFNKDKKLKLEEALTITMLKTNEIYTYGMQVHNPLPGTITTLDGIDGWTQLPPGHVAIDGWSVLDDIKSQIIGEDGNVYPREGKGIDLYFFFYNKDYQHFLKEFFRIAGSSPMLPRYALGNWWSRYYEYTDEELLRLTDDFKEREIPLSVCIVDMDWHLEGWTGYTWNKKLFKEPNTFIDALHQRGLRTALNLHPADGIAPYEEAYEKAKERMGLGEDFKASIPFALDQSTFTKAYFELLHHPREEEGVDFWWIDWQQQNELANKDLDVLWLLNHQHYLDLQRDGKKRPMTFSRWSKQGSHRYPIAFSGDSIVNWESLSFQPYMTASASNVACFWWSHDIGGHMLGVENGELFTRWVQYGVFSPIFRIHSSKNRFQDRRPWHYTRDEYEVMKEAMTLRHKLIPYIYTMNRRSEEGIPLIAPLYYNHKEDVEAYHAYNAYYFGTELIAAPYTSPKDAVTNLAKQEVYLPEGDFFDYFTGEYYKGGRKYQLYGDLEKIPVFAKAGAIIPEDYKPAFGEVGNPDEIYLNLFAGASNSFTLYEDDGETLEYKEGCYALTRIEAVQGGDSLTYTIHPVEGGGALVPSKRQYHFVIKGITKPQAYTVKVNGMAVITKGHYEEGIFRIDTISLTPQDTLEVKVSFKSDIIRADKDRRIYLEWILQKAAIPNDKKEALYWAYEALRWGTYDELLLKDVPEAVREAIFNTILER